MDSLKQILGPEATADSDALPTTDDHTPPYLVVQTRDGEPPAPETVDELLELGYTPLDGERGPDRGGGGWPIEAEAGYQDHPLVGASAFRLIESFSYQRSPGVVSYSIATDQMTMFFIYLRLYMHLPAQFI